MPTNEFAFLATGRYGKSLANQTREPIRLVVPWKYGFKGGKVVGPHDSVGFMMFPQSSTATKRRTVRPGHERLLRRSCYLGAQCQPYVLNA